MNLQARYIEEVGTAYVFRIHWTTQELACVNGSQRHYAETEIVREIGPYNKDIGMGTPWPKRGNPLYPHACKSCGLPVPTDESVKIDESFVTQRLYNTASGRPEPGDIYFRQLNCKVWGCGYGWTNCSGIHLHTVLPTGEPWDVDSRASNCTMKDDGEHRCWVRHGDPSKGELVHVDKNGLTCAAGAGSIATSQWHGFLHHGIWHV